MIKELGEKIVSPDKANFKNTEGFRLPTEVEWEWFASGGQKAIEQGTFNYIYSGSNNIDEVAWYYENIGKFDDASTQEVGLKKSNQLGLYDCSGNVWEWCYDTIEFDENGDYKNIKNGNLYMYEAFDLSNTYRRMKGGSWGNGNKDCAIFHRGCNQAINVKEYFRYFGFRIVRTI